MKKIVLFSTQRSGSTMVCDDFAGTNLLGRPSEYFIKLIECNEKLSSKEKKIEILKIDNLSSTSNGVSAIKIMSNQITEIGNILLESKLVDAVGPDIAFDKYFSGSKFIRIKRNDKVAQAVSRVLAAETNVYHASDNSKGLEGMLGKLSKDRDETGVQYSSEKIEEEINRINQEERFIDAFVSKLGFKIKEIIYENVISDRSYIMDIASEMGINNIKLGERRLKKIGGGVSSDWINRFKSEHY